MNKIKFKNYILNFLTVIISTFLGLLIANIIFISVSTQNYFPRSLAGSLPNILLTFYPDTYNKDNLEDYVAITGDSYSQGGGDAYLNGIRDYAFAHHLHKNDNKNYLNFEINIQPGVRNRTYGPLARKSEIHGLVYQGYFRFGSSSIKCSSSTINHTSGNIKCSSNSIKNTSGCVNCE